MSYRYTKNCIVCGDVAVSWTGHVKETYDQRPEDFITAGFCEKHIETPCPNLLDEYGCFGIYSPEFMGVQERD